MAGQLHCNLVLADIILSSTGVVLEVTTGDVLDGEGVPAAPVLYLDPAAVLVGLGHADPGHLGEGQSLEDHGQPHLGRREAVHRAHQLRLVALALVDEHLGDVHLRLVLHDHLHLLGGPGAVAIAGGAPGRRVMCLSDCLEGDTVQMLCLLVGPCMLSIHPGEGDRVTLY